MKLTARARALSLRNRDGGSTEQVGVRPWVADKRARRGRKRQTGGCWAGWPRLELLRWLGWREEKGLGWAAGGPGGLLRWLQADTLLFLFVQTEIETEKHKVKGEELEYKENTLKLLELPTILINCIGHF